MSQKKLFKKKSINDISYIITHAKPLKHLPTTHLSMYFVPHKFDLTSNVQRNFL